MVSAVSTRSSKPSHCTQKFKGSSASFSPLFIYPHSFVVVVTCATVPAVAAAYPTYIYITYLSKWILHDPAPNPRYYFYTPYCYGFYPPS